MQQRERYYRAPRDPLELIRRKLTTSSTDAQLARGLDGWQTVWLTGNPPGTKTVQELDELASRSSLDALTLLEAARGFDFLAGDQLAAAFIRAALAKASRDHAVTQSGDPAALPLLRELDQSNALWRLDDYQALELRFRLARGFNPRLSVESRRAGCLLADALFYQERFDEAADVIVEVEAENLRVGDLGALDQSDLYEMEFLQGYLLCCAGRYELAIPHLRHVVGRGEHAPVASRCLFEALLQTNRVEDAQACCDQLMARFNISASGQAVMARRLEQVRQSTQWRRSVLTPSG